MLLCRRFHHPVNGRFRRNIVTTVHQRRDDLTRRLTGKLWAVDQGKIVRCSALLHLLVGAARDAARRASSMPVPPSRVQR